MTDEMMDEQREWSKHRDYERQEKQALGHFSMDYCPDCKSQNVFCDIGDFSVNKRCMGCLAVFSVRAELLKAR